MASRFRQAAMSNAELQKLKSQPADDKGNKKADKKEKGQKDEPAKNEKRKYEGGEKASRKAKK